MLSMNDISKLAHVRVDAKMMGSYQHKESAMVLYMTRAVVGEAITASYLILYGSFRTGPIPSYCISSRCD